MSWSNPRVFCSERQPGIEIIEFTLEPERSYCLTEHNSGLWWVGRSLSVSTESRTLEATAGALFTCPPRGMLICRSGARGGQVRLLSLSQRRVPAAFRSLFQGKAPWAAVGQNRPLQRPLRELERGLSRGSDRDLSPSLEHLLDGFASSADPNWGIPRLIPKPVKEMIKAIEANRSSGLSLQEIVDATTMSKYHAVRLFKNHVGISPYHCVIAGRLATARWLLRAGHSTSEVSERLGFTDGSHLRRQFAQMFGMKPTEYVRGILPDDVPF